MSDTLVGTLLGLAGGVGVLLVYYGARRLADRGLPAARRRRGFWPLNGGLVLIAVSLLWLFRMD